MKTLIIRIFLLLLLPAATIDGQNVEVTITGIRNPEGQMVIGVFMDDESFRKEQSGCRKKGSDSPIIIIQD
jgi:uncharacterized protein (DUF2141 family)